MSIRERIGALLGRKTDKGSIADGRAATRAGDALGPWTGHLSGYVAREIDPHLYETLREAVPFIDAAIDTTLFMDGIVEVETENDALRRVIEEFMEGVPVGDYDQGFQVFYQLLGNEAYEQGHHVGEIVMAPRGRDIARLLVADSKGIHYVREKGGNLACWYAPQQRRNTNRTATENIERVLRNSYRNVNHADLERGGYRKLTNTDRLVRFRYQPEADNPYGTSLIRSTEFMANTLVVVTNALNQNWTRWGDPIFHVSYKTKNRQVAGDQAKLNARRDAFAKNLADAFEAKREGNSVDVATATGMDDEIEFKVIGQEGQVMEVENPARFLLEGIVAKTGIAPWMMGLVWGTAERLAQRQADAALYKSKVRFERRRPGLERVIATMLRARGITWRRGDWRLTQNLPSLQDIVATAQARFLETQADMMQQEGTTNPEGGNE